MGKRGQPPLALAALVLPSAPPASHRAARWELCWQRGSSVPFLVQTRTGRVPPRRRMTWPSSQTQRPRWSTPSRCGGAKARIAELCPGCIQGVVHDGTRILSLEHASAPRPTSSAPPAQYLAYRTDDHGNTAASATVLAGTPLATDANRLTATTAGAIERTEGARPAPRARGAPSARVRHPSRCARAAMTFARHHPSSPSAPLRPL